MVKIKGKIKTEQLRVIKWGVKAKLSANQIQKQLRAKGLGIRRKVLLEEIRVIKKKKITPEKRKKHIPKKYREKPKRIIIREPTTLFRVSYIITDIPVHSKPFKRVYLGFRLTAFSISSDFLISRHDYLKRLLVKLSNEYLGSDILGWENYDVTIGIERPTRILVSQNLNGVWIFRVEQEGSEIYSRSGRL